MVIPARRGISVNAYHFYGSMTILKVLRAALIHQFTLLFLAFPPFSARNGSYKKNQSIFVYSMLTHHHSFFLAITIGVLFGFQLQGNKCGICLDQKHDQL